VNASFLQHPMTQRVGWVLLHSLWQGALLGILFEMSRLALRRRSANVRYLAGCTALALSLAIPVVTLLSWPTPPAPVSSAAEPSSGQPAATSITTVMGTMVHDQIGAEGNPWLDWCANFFAQLAPLLTPAWLLGVLFFTFRLAQSYRWVERLRTQQNELVDSAWLECLDDLRCRLEISRPVVLLQSALVEVPTVIGWLRPVILLPAATLTGLTPGQLQAILAHELAHVRRFDYLVNAGQCVIETLLFYHPVVWWISRCVREERENCCDDLVVKVCADRLTYARALATLEEFRTDIPDLAFAASGGSLLNRIRRLLGAGSDTPLTARQCGGLGLMGLGLVLMLFGIYLQILPDCYRAVARLSVRVDVERSSAGGISDGGLARVADPYYLQTVYELIQSEVVLGKVIKKLDLNAAWGKKYARGEKLKTAETMTLLRARMSLRPVRNTSLIEVGVGGDAPKEVAQIANEIAAAYKSFRLEYGLGMTRDGIEALEQQYRQQETRIKEAQTNVDYLRRELNIPDSIANSDAPTMLLTAETLHNVERLRIESKAELGRLEALVASLKQLGSNVGPERLAQAMPSAMPDPLLLSLLEQLNLAQQRLLTVRKEFGEQHLEVVKAKSIVEDLEAKIKVRTGGIMDGLDARIASLRRGLTDLQQEVETAKKEDIELANTSHAYFEAKRNLEELQRFRQLLSMKIASEKIEVALPRIGQVEIVDTAIPPLRASTPNRPRATALLMLGLLLEVVGLMLLKDRPRTALVLQAA
jgi:uncharacterized protein involved in exopolysaccharide biosynthesis/beta-lactamase regulating signal transducer with metallopeptidase domain